VSSNRSGRFTVQSTIGDILHHSALAGFSRLILPWDDRAYDEDMRLSQIGSLLPYHTHVDPATVINALNRMINDASSGKTVFYSFYSEAQKKQQPDKSNTGLFFFRGRPGTLFTAYALVAGSPTSAPSMKGFPTRKLLYSLT
jgi:hypothetical protein